MTVTELIKLLKKYEFDENGNANNVLFRTNDGYDTPSWTRHLDIVTMENGDVQIGDMLIER